MYISNLVIEGYRCFKEKTVIPLNEGLTLFW